MISAAPYVEYLVYMIQTKMQGEIPADLRFDLESKLYEFARKCSEQEKVRADEWRKKAIGV
jgi:hypothetical protein